MMKTGTKVAIGVGVVAGVGLLLFFATKSSAKTTGSYILGPDGRRTPVPLPTIDVDASDVEPVPGIPFPEQSVTIPGDSLMPEIKATRQPGGAWRVTDIDGQPVSPDPAEAKSKAQSMSDHVRSKAYNYDRPRLAVWQALAGKSADGLYGPSTVTALKDFGAVNVPAALFKGAGVANG